MIEKEILDFLLEQTGEEGYMEIPAGTPEDAVFFLVEKTGSGKVNHLCSATIAVKSHAPTLYGAAALNERIKAAMENLITLDRITRVRLNSDYNFTDTASKRYRYQAVFDIFHYEES